MVKIVVGTYGEKLGHVHGKGKGLYVLKYERDTGFAPSSDFIGTPQLSNLKNPTFLTSHRDEASGELHLYIVDERNDGAGSVNAAKIDETTGELTQLAPSVPAEVDLRPGAGAACCHISVTPGGKHVLAANYLGGSIVAIARKPDGSLDESTVQYLHFPPASHPIAFPMPNANRQESSHAHMALASSGTKGVTILVPDLGSDVVWSVPYDASKPAASLGVPVATASHPALSGGGPRHAALHPTHALAYVCYELSSAVACFALDKETGAIVGEPLGVVNALGGFESGAGACDGGFLGGGGGGGAGTSRASQAYGQLVEPNTGVGDAVASLKSGHGRTRCSDAKTSLAACHVTPNGSHVVVSNRVVGGDGALSAIPLTADGLFAEGEQTPVVVTATLGRTPRDFIMLPPAEAAATDGARKLLALAANQDTDEIVALYEGETARVLTSEVPTPVCLCVLPSA